MANKRKYLESSFQDANYNFLDITDGTLLTEDGHSFPIHKFLLSRCSQKFWDIFCGMQSGERDLLIPGIRGEVLSNILTYIYHGRINISEENACDVFVASYYISLKDLLSQTKTFLDEHLSVGNCVAVYLSALKVKCTDLLKESYRLIQTHFEELIYSTDTTFCELPVDILKQFLKEDNLRVENENAIWHAIVKWVEADPTHRLHQAFELLMHLRVCDIDDNLAAEIVTHPIVANNPTCCTLTLKKILNNYQADLGLNQQGVWPDATISFPLLKPRKPSSLNFISECLHLFDEEPNGVKMYVTYDENVDLWRQIPTFDFIPTFVACIGDFFYAFNEGIKERYSIIADEMGQVSDFKIPRSGYAVVELDGFLYILGGYSDADELSPDMDRRSWRPINDVEIYHPEEDEWHEITPMIPVIDPFFAATLNGSIYVVGINDIGTGLCAQMYNPSTKLWQLLPEPPFRRKMVFTLAAYKEQLYVIGARNAAGTEKSVLVFCPLKKVWISKQNLPYRYNYPRALIINDRLIVSEDPTALQCPAKDPPVVWNNDGDCWESIEESSPLFNVHYYIFAAQEIDNLSVILRQNKMPTTVFEKSPFA